MCNDIADRRSRSAAHTLKPARKTRTKTRKPKFLSLRLQLSPETAPPSGRMTTTTTNSAAADRRHQHQLNLFPLHPEHQLVDDDKDTHDDNMAYFFDSADGGATTLTTLLGPGSSEEEENVQSPCRGQDRDDVVLVRTAMRSKERDASEDRWVSYSEVTSCAAEPHPRHGTQQQQQGLSLKLDYREIINAWSDKGPLFIRPPECPQTVPDLHDHDFFFGGDPPYPNGWESNGGPWAVPEMRSSTSGEATSTVQMRVKEEAGEEGKAAGQREASVLRYKEKRQNRLFSKRIRYEVRKINAEKRPRIKGRFVKRC